MINNGFYSKLYFAINRLDHRQCVTCRDALHLQTKSLLNKILANILITVVPLNNKYFSSNYRHLLVIFTAALSPTISSSHYNVTSQVIIITLIIKDGMG